jgi:hypothetical protein
MTIIVSTNNNYYYEMPSSIDDYIEHIADAVRDQSQFEVHSTESGHLRAAF